MRYALVTGGSRGIGSAICKALADDGFFVIINYNNSRKAAETVKKEIEAKGGQAELLPFDVADAQATENAITQWQDSHKDDYISVLVNTPAYVWTLSLSLWTKTNGTK